MFIPKNKEFGDHKPISNVQHVINLIKLSDYLFSLPDDYAHFDMQHFYCLYPGTKMQTLIEDFAGYECNTVACAIGHGPAAGIPIHEDDDLWPRYARRVFGYDDFSGDFMFGIGYVSLDNTPKGAAMRIRYVVEYGLPSVYIHREVVDYFDRFK